MSVPRVPKPVSPRRSAQYSPAKKAELIRLAERLGVAAAAERSGVSRWTLYDWRRKVRAKSKKAAPAVPVGSNGSREPIETPPRVEVPESVQRRVVAVWSNNPGFGPSQVRNQLRRVGVRLDTKTVRKILKKHGYVPPAMKPPRPKEIRRFEASRPLELAQMDVLQFYVHGQRVYLFLMLDDHSRFLTGWDLLQRESMDDAVRVFEDAVRRYGKPEAVLTDRGATFHTWSGIGRFDRMLEAYDVDHILAAPEHPRTCGKIEAVNKAIQKELIDRVEFRNFLDAKEQIGRWIDDFNHQRTHQGLGGVLVPADRFFGRADRVLERIEGSHGPSGRDPVPPELQTSDEHRAVSLFHIRLVEGILELWLFGRLVRRLKAEEDA